MGKKNTIATMMLNIWRSAGFEDGIRTKRAPRGYAMSRHDSSCGSKNQFHAMYLWQKCLIYYLDLVDSGIESVGQRQEKGVHVSCQHLELVEVRSTQDNVYRG